MKKITNVHVLLIILPFLGCVLLSSCFNIFPKEEDSLCLLKPTGENFKLEIVSVSTGATTDATLQVKKVENDKIKILKTIPKYDAISGYSIKGSYLKLFIYDSLNSESKIDTISIKFK